MKADHISPLGRGLLDRRSFMQTAGFSLGGLGLASLLAEDDPTGFSGKQPIRPAIDVNNPYAPRPPHFAVPAKHVLGSYCPGAVTQVLLATSDPLFTKIAERTLRLEDPTPHPDAPSRT